MKHTRVESCCTKQNERTVGLILPEVGAGNVWWESAPLVATSEDSLVEEVWLCVCVCVCMCISLLHIHCTILRYSTIIHAN